MCFQQNGKSQKDKSGIPECLTDGENMEDAYNMAIDAKITVDKDATLVVIKFII